MDDANTNTEAKTFTQEEVNQIVQDRLFKERKKYDGIDLDKMKADIEALTGKLAESENKLTSETERANGLNAELDALKKANAVRDIREKVARENDIPADLLHGETEDDCKAEAERLVEFARPKGYPSVKDGGEVVAPATKQTTREQFAQWMKEAL